MRECRLHEDVEDGVLQNAVLYLGVLDDERLGIRSKHGSIVLLFYCFSLRLNNTADLHSFRFHAWQSSLLFSAAFLLHLIFSFSTVLSWMLLIVDFGAIGFLTMRAYRDGESLLNILKKILKREI